MPCPRRFATSSHVLCRIGDPCCGLPRCSALSVIPLHRGWADDSSRPGLAADELVAAEADRWRHLDRRIKRRPTSDIQAADSAAGPPALHGPPRRRQRAAPDRRRSVRFAPRGHDDSDPEVAASARYLLRQITVRWVHSDDSARACADCCATTAQQSRRAACLPVLDGLAQLPNGEGVRALCRIARFDRSPLVSRQAALAIIRPDRAAKPTDPDRSGGRRPGAGHQHARAAARGSANTWCRLRDPAASVASWQQLSRRGDRRSSSRTPTTHRPKSFWGCSGTWPSPSPAGRPTRRWLTPSIE